MSPKAPTDCTTCLHMGDEACDHYALADFEQAAVGDYSEGTVETVAAGRKISEWRDACEEWDDERPGASMRCEPRCPSWEGPQLTQPTDDEVILVEVHGRVQRWHGNGEVFYRVTGPSPSWEVSPLDGPPARGWQLTGEEQQGLRIKLVEMSRHNLEGTLISRLGELDQRGASLWRGYKLHHQQPYLLAVDPVYEPILRAEGIEAMQIGPRAPILCNRGGELLAVVMPRIVATTADRERLLLGTTNTARHAMEARR